jgi:hypothetical protein
LYHVASIFLQKIGDGWGSVIVPLMAFYENCDEPRVIFFSAAIKLGCCSYYTRWRQSQSRGPGGGD